MGCFHRTTPSALCCGLTSKKEPMKSRSTLKGSEKHYDNDNYILYTILIFLVNMANGSNNIELE